VKKYVKYTIFKNITRWYG